MKVRDAKISDVKAIHALVASYAELDRMLFRSPADIYENLQTFKVAEVDSSVAGCSALQVIWTDLAEVKSLAVAEDCHRQGIATALVEAAQQDAHRLGISRLFAFTLEPEFFVKLGFSRIDAESLPMKVWSDCAKCPKQDRCDEVAVLLELG